MTNKIIIDGIDVKGCSYLYTDRYGDLCCDSAICKGFSPCKPSETLCSFYVDQLKTKLNEKEQECEELHNRTASIIYRLTGGRLSYSTYTLEGCEDAYTDQLRIDVERATKEIEEENEELKKQLEEYQDQEPTIVNTICNLQLQVIAWIEQSQKYKQALDEIQQIVEFAMEEVLTLGQKNATSKILDIINKAKEQ